MRRQYEKVADEVLQISQEFPYGKLHPILRLPWFRRVWVFQEVVLARKVVFYCGERLIAFENLAFATDFTRVPYSKSDSLALHWRSYLEGHNACIRLLRLKEKGEDSKLPHQYLLTIVANLDVTQPEDKIHAMYGYAKRMELDWPIPDYTKSVAQIYTEVTIACFRQSKDLEVILMAIGPASEEFGLPSWVPDFSRRFTDYSPSKPPKIDPVPFRNKQCSGTTECDWILIPNGRRLKVKGRKIDYITAVSEPWQADATTTLLGGADFNSGQIFDSFIECIGSWYEVALQRSMTHNDGADSAHQFVAVSDLVCLLTRAHLGRTTLPDQFAELISALISCTRRDMVALRTVFIHPDNDNNQIRITPQMQQAIERLAPLIWKLIFRTTVKSCMGISNYNAKAGDLLVVLHGMASPCVVRPCAGGFNFIGQAFVPEVMNGEFWDGGSDEDDEWFTLI
ncbi:hypothetical protein GT037_010130 [Alternaria burnsii]|uniref:Heterokaryon incompatibility domain-containing protein n=1 Tax=Alternaria burnsii TaxID=1187904 RepID=A0A8H7AWJ1_9PLEO|nr:uncharacterized protein GT037_010130 [Alternaria burnsii]KAF7671907.1 hypothetical protein GT037_010130 [Alternaria burnsii]